MAGQPLEDDAVAAIGDRHVRAESRHGPLPGEQVHVCDRRLRVVDDRGLLLDRVRVHSYAPKAAKARDALRHRLLRETTD